MAAGWVHYTYREGVGLCAALAGDDGVRYLYVRLGRPEGQPRHVAKDEIIAYTPTAEERAADAAAEREYAQLTAGEPEQEPLDWWVFDAPVPQTRPAPRGWPRQIEVLMFGLPLAGVMIALGAPLAGAAVGTATLIIAAGRPKG